MHLLKSRNGSPDSEMDDIAKQAVESYEQLMTLGMNMTDMAAGLCLTMRQTC